MRKLLLAAPLLLILLTSGCTSLPDGFCIPGLTCGVTNEETHDVIVIDSLQALPNNVVPGGTVNLVAIISNVADIDAEIKDIENIEVELYDYCEGLFDVKSVNGNPVPASQKDKGLTEINSLLRGQKKQVEWILKASDKSQVPVKTECELKIRAKYKYATRSITTLHFIDYAEMQRRMNEGTYKEIGSYISVGYGPIKPYIRVEGTQPIPVTSIGGGKDIIDTVFSFQIENKGKGFLSPNKDGKIAIDAELLENGITATGETQIVASEIKSKCLKNINDNAPVELIKGESAKFVCQIHAEVSDGYVPVDTTKTLIASIGEIKDGKVEKGYDYEFRSSVKVTVEPKF